jgi:hypothetical protein
MHKLSIYIITILILGACTSNTIYKKPDDLISKKQMVNLLTDIYIANAASGIKNKNLEKNIDYMPLIYEKYGIDSIRFQHSNTYYISRLDDYKEIFEKVEERIKIMLDTTTKSQSIKDSIKLAKKRPDKELLKAPLKKPLTEKKPKFLDKKQK